MTQDTARNLLIICSDEHRKDALGAAGHLHVKTPHLDALAGRGTIFENAYSPSPICVPARAAMATGDHVHRIGAWDSAAPYAGGRESWMHRLRRAGVEVVSIGKLHFRSTDDDNGFSEEILPMHVVGGVGWAIGLLREDPPDYDAAAELSRDVGTGSSSYTDYDLAITDAAEVWLRQQASAKQPWAGFISLVSPHYPLIAPAEYYQLYDPDTVDLPVAYQPGSRPDHPELNNIANFFDYDRYFNQQSMREARVAYYGLTSFMDNCVGRVLDTLEKTGQADNTVVLYVSDHGDMLGDHGLWTKQVMYEASAGVPMILAGPGVPEGRCVKTCSSLLDIAATATDVTGITADDLSAALPGKSLRALANCPDDMDRTVLSEYHDGGSSTGTFMIRWDRWKYVYYVGYPSQLFDLDNDPDELDDLLGHADASPEIQQVCQEAEHRLRAICNPEEVDKLCFSDQKRRIDELGGKEACANAFVFNHTPVPNGTGAL